MMTNQKIKIDISKCDFCGVCLSVCLPSAIIMKETDIFLDDEKCKRCYWCIDVCPLGLIQMDSRVRDYTEKEK